MWSHGWKDKKEQEILVSYSGKNIIVATILKDSQTYFIVFDKDLNQIYEKREVEINGEKYVPLKSSSSFIRSWSILFPSWIEDYGSVKKLIEEIDCFIYKYVDIPDGYRIICSYYVLLTYVYEDFNEIPYLRVIWDYGSWKSRLLKTLWSICHNQMMTTGWNTVSSIFRMIEIFKWTLIFDEADLSASGTQSEIIKILNNWYQKGMPIMRADGNKFELNCYEVFCPKIIWWRMEFQDKATESRCLSCIMKRSKRTDIPKSLIREFDGEALLLRNKLLKYRFDYLSNIELKNDSVEWLEPRLNQILNPILSLIDCQDTEQVVIDHLLQKQKDLKDERKASILGVVLEIIWNSMNSFNETISFENIITSLEMAEWKTFLTPRKLWSLLRQNGIKGTRRNYGTVIEFHENGEDLIRLFQEYWIDTPDPQVDSSYEIKESTKDFNPPY